VGPREKQRCGGKRLKRGRALDRVGQDLVGWGWVGPSRKRPSLVGNGFGKGVLGGPKVRRAGAKRKDESVMCVAIFMPEKKKKKTKKVVEKRP